MKRILLLARCAIGKAGETVSAQDDYANRLLRMGAARKAQKKAKAREAVSTDEPCRQD